MPGEACPECHYLVGHRRACSKRPNVTVASWDEAIEAAAQRVELSGAEMSASAKRRVAADIRALKK